MFRVLLLTALLVPLHTLRVSVCKGTSKAVSSKTRNVLRHSLGRENHY